MKSWIDIRFDDFFNKSGKEYLNMDIFREVFDMLETNEYKIDNPALYTSELARIRDLHNSFTYAFEEGRKEGVKIIQKSKELLQESYNISDSKKSTGLSKEKILKLKE